MDENLDFRFECGYSKPSSQLKLADQQKLVHAVWLHYVFFSIHAELAQFRKGLYETLQFEALVNSHPKVIHSFLVSSPSYDISASFLIDCFAVGYSAEGSNNRTREEAIMLWWSDYVLDSAGEYPFITCTLSYLIFSCPAEKKSCTIIKDFTLYLWINQTTSMRI